MLDTFDKTSNVRQGDGSETNPYRSADGTAGIQDELSALSERGGILNLKSARYDIERPIVIDSSSLCLDGGVWACNTDPNGVFESKNGTKLRMHGKSFSALRVGVNTDPISGAIIRNLGIQGDISGMDTRHLVNFNQPTHSAGLSLDGTRCDQCAFTKLSLCGLANGVSASGSAEIDACIFENINTDGCGNGFWFSPRASYYARVRACIMADNPYYGFYLGANGKNIHNLEILDCHFVRNGGAFTDSDGMPPAAVFFDNVSRCAITQCIFDDPGTFWFYDENATENSERQPSHRKTPALRIAGNENRIRGNTFLNSSDDSATIVGDGNILIGNVCDGNVRIRGRNNVVSTLVFTKPTSRLILEEDACDSTVILGVEPHRIVKADQAL